jgi:AAA family ATP:ADP antiporter
MATVIGSQWMDRLFLTVFLVMLAAVPVYGYEVSKFGRRWLVPIVYRFFSLWLIGFYFAMRSTDAPSFWVACTFFVWVSVFNLFAVSIFWSVMADIFSSDQGQRLFGPIAAGGSLGGLASSLFVANFASQVGVATLLLVPVVVLELALACGYLLSRKPTARPLNATAVNDVANAPTGGGIFEGLLSVFKSPYLMGICVFLLLGKFCATAIYLQLIGIVETQVPEVAKRAELFAIENTVVQAITMAFQLVLTTQFMRHYGLSFTLGLLPLGLVAGFAALAFEPTLLMALFVQVMQRSLAYGVTNPAREVLFTVVPREQKYKSKGFLDTVVFRGGDALSSRLYTAISGSQFGASIVTMVMIPAAICWTAISWSLGRQQRRLQLNQREATRQASVM